MVAGLVDRGRWCTVLEVDVKYSDPKNCQRASRPLLKVKKSRASQQKIWDCQSLKSIYVLYYHHYKCTKVQPIERLTIEATTNRKESTRYSISLRISLSLNIEYYIS